MKNGSNYHFWSHRICSSSFSFAALPVLVQAKALKVDVMRVAQSLLGLLGSAEAREISMHVPVTLGIANASSRLDIPTTS